jgi:hypothetical protein
MLPIALYPQRTDQRAAVLPANSGNHFWLVCSTIPEIWGKQWRRIGGGKCWRIIAPMTVAKNHDAYDQGEPPTWAWPVYAFVAWLASILDYLARFKRIRRTHKFKPNWRDCWEGLRESEWHRDQLIAQGVAQLLAGEPLQLDDTKIELTAPASYGGPCPRTPFDMNRRFIALARWAADPEAMIRARYKRLVRSLLSAHGSTDARSAATHEALGVAALSDASAALILRDREAIVSKDEGVLACARGPPNSRYSLLPTPNCRESPRFRERPRTSAA